MALPIRAADVADLGPSPLQVARRVRALSAALPGDPITMRHEADGNVAVILPAAMAELYVQDLEQRAKVWQEKLEQVKLKEMKRRATIQAAVERSRHHLETLETRYALAFAKLRAQGVERLEAIRRIAGARKQPAPYGSFIADCIARGLARLRKQKQLEVAATVRDAYATGEHAPEIARRLGLPTPRIYSLLRMLDKVSVLPGLEPLPDYPELRTRVRPHTPRASLPARDAEIRSLALFEGLSVRAIADRLGVSIMVVSHALKREGVRPGDGRRGCGRVFGGRDPEA